MVPILCPEPGCDAQAFLTDLPPVVCRVWESFSSGGVAWSDPDEGRQELVEMVEAVCAAGHSFRGPAEMLDGRGD